MARYECDTVELDSCSYATKIRDHDMWAQVYICCFQGTLTEFTQDTGAKCICPAHKEADQLRTTNTIEDCAELFTFLLPPNIVFTTIEPSR